MNLADCETKRLLNCPLPVDRIYSSDLGTCKYQVFVHRTPYKLMENEPLRESIVHRYVNGANIYRKKDQSVEN